MKKESSPAGGRQGSLQVAGESQSERTSRRLIATPASASVPRAIRWLWAEDGGQWLPLGHLALLAGREGVGKSTFTYGLSAQITRGTLPGKCFGTPRSVLVSATEEAWDESVVPKLMAAGADLSRVFHVKPFFGPVDLTQDVAELERLAEEKDAALLLLDPLMSVVGSRTKTRDFQSVQAALEPVVEVAQKARMSVLGLIHLNKSQGVDLVSKIMDSRAFASVARAILVASRDDRQEGDRETFVLGQEKSNYGPRVPHVLRYVIQAEEVGTDQEDGEPLLGQRLVFLGREKGSVQAIVTEQESRGSARVTQAGRAEEWLTGFLREHGPMESSSVKEAGVAAGFSKTTVERTARRLPVTVMSLPGSTKTQWSLHTTSDVDEVHEVDDVNDVDDVDFIHVNRVIHFTTSVEAEPLVLGAFAVGGRVTPVPDPVAHVPVGTDEERPRGKTYRVPRRLKVVSSPEDPNAPLSPKELETWDRDRLRWWVVKQGYVQPAGLRDYPSREDLVGLIVKCSAEDKDDNYGTEESNDE